MAVVATYVTTWREGTAAVVPQGWSWQTEGAAESVGKGNAQQGWGGDLNVSQSVWTDNSQVDFVQIWVLSIIS